VAEAAGLVRVLTWNIHSGIGPDGRYDLERVVRLVQRHEPDIVALQEIAISIG
jgi:endonuclease/exonuclease/phosphatase family metal-dependent hydrolase